MRSRLSTLIALAALSLAQPLFAQRAPAYFGDIQYQRLGLEEVWSTQIQLDAGRATLAGMRLQVIGRESHDVLQATASTIYDVKFGEGQIRSVRSNQLDSAGYPLGQSEARRLAEKLEIVLKARGFEPELTERQVPATMLYVQATSGTLQAMDAETGKVEWKRFVGTPGHPAIIPAANDEYVAAVSGSTLHLFDREGRVVWTRGLAQNPTLGATMAGRRVFVPGLRGQIEAYELPDEISDHHASPPWKHNASGRIVTVPFASESTISWGTDHGDLVVAELIDGQPSLSYRVETAGPIHGGGASLAPDHLVITSANGFVTLLEKNRGNVVWRFSTGSSIDTEPVAHDDEVYVATTDLRLFSISASEGIERWVVDGIKQVLASGQARVYALDSANRLTAIDKQSGTVLGRLPAGGYSLPFINHLTDRIYLASTSGELLCLREINSPDPSIRVTLAQPAEQRTIRRTRDDSAETGDDTSDVDDGGDDGFGGFGDGFGDDGDDGDGDFGDDSGDDMGADDMGGDDFDFGDDSDVDFDDESPADDDAGDDGDNVFNFGDE